MPDRLLEAKLKAEWPGILRWMIDGCLDWQTNGLLRPATVRSATADYFEAQDVLSQFLAERCDVEPDNLWKSERGADLFKMWSDYARAAGEEPGTRRSFGDRMQRRGIAADKGAKGARVFRGIRFKLEDSFMDASDLR